MIISLTECSPTKSVARWLALPEQSSGSSWLLRGVGLPEQTSRSGICGTPKAASVS